MCFSWGKTVGFWLCVYGHLLNFSDLLPFWLPLCQIFSVRWRTRLGIRVWHKYVWIYQSMLIFLIFMHLLTWFFSISYLCGCHSIHWMWDYFRSGYTLFAYTCTQCRSWWMVWFCKGFALDFQFLSAHQFSSAQANFNSGPTTAIFC